jgi:predicted amidohydrolase YtcJ
MEDKIGSLEAGKYADLVVLDRDYMTIPVDEIYQIKPVMTIFAGEVVYQAE